MDIQAYIESGVIESYVLGLASAEEAAEVVALSELHPEVKTAIDEFTQSLEQLAFENAVQPPAAIKDKLINHLAGDFETEEDETAATVIPFATRIKAQEDSVPPQSLIQTKPLRIWQYMAAASVLLFVLSAALNIYFYSNYKTVSGNYQALLIQRNSLQASNNVYRTKMEDFAKTMKVLTDPGMLIVKMPGVKGRENNLATVYWDKKTKDVYILPNKLPETQADKQFQLWAIVDGKPVDAGVIEDCNGVCKMKNIPKAQAFAVTLEKKGGSDTPTLPAMYVLGKV